MNWAWHQGIKPVPKLVLMVLADAADDQGVCWPSVITGTTIGTQKEPLQPPAPENEQADYGGGKLLDLIYPKDLLPAEGTQAETMIAVLVAPLNQQVLD